MLPTRHGAAALCLTGATPGARSAPPDGPRAPTTTAHHEPRASTPIGPATTPGSDDCLFELTRPGAYHLPGHLVGLPGMHGIRIAADNVSIDLRGFALMGVEGSLCGVRFDGRRAAFGAAVRNGAVSGWGGSGVDLATCEGALVEDLRAAHNAGDGVVLGCFGRAARLTALRNGNRGVWAVRAGTITDSTASRNGGQGFAAGAGSTLRACTACANAARGFSLESGCVARECIAMYNGLEGFYAFQGCTIASCTAISNHVGYTLHRMNTLRDSTSRFDRAVGVRTEGFANRVIENHVISSPIGFDIDGADNQLEGNFAASTRAAYEIETDNLAAPVVAAVAPGVPPHANLRR